MRLGRTLLATAVLVMTLGAGGTSAEQVKLPTTIQQEHAELHAELAKAVKEPGALGAAAREVERLLTPHFQKEEQFALPPLALLPKLATGGVTPEMRDVLPLTDRLERELPQMLKEHQQIGQALEKLSRVARQEQRMEVVAWVERLRMHAKQEEEVLYPAAIVVGKLIKQGSHR